MRYYEDTYNPITQQYFGGLYGLRNFSVASPLSISSKVAVLFSNDPKPVPVSYSSDISVNLPNDSVSVPIVVSSDLNIINSNAEPFAANHELSLNPEKDGSTSKTEVQRIGNSRRSPFTNDRRGINNDLPNIDTRIRKIEENRERKSEYGRKSRPVADKETKQVYSLDEQIDSVFGKPHLIFSRMSDTKIEPTLKSLPRLPAQKQQMRTSHKLDLSTFETSSPKADYESTTVEKNDYTKRSQRDNRRIRTSLFKSTTSRPVYENRETKLLENPDDSRRRSNSSRRRFFYSRQPDLEEVTKSSTVNGRRPTRGFFSMLR